jgi:hypothetical protein
MTAGGEVSARAWSWRRRLGARGALGFGAIAVVLLAAVAQLLLPRIAAGVLRDKVARYGEVRSASVRALPALQLLWGSADSAHLSAGSLRISLHQVVALLAESRPVTDVTASARSVELVEPGFGMGAVTFTHAVLEKHGDAVEMRALLTKAALQAALPVGVRMEVLPGDGGLGERGRGEGGVAVRASGRLFGLGASLDALLHVAEGKLLLEPAHPLLAGAGRLTLFADRRLQLLGVSARGEGSPAGAAAGGWLLSVSARLR